VIEHVEPTTGQIGGTVGVDAPGGECSRLVEGLHATVQVLGQESREMLVELLPVEEGHPGCMVCHR
jgi:hypothetical protein